MHSLHNLPSSPQNPRPQDLNQRKTISPLVQTTKKNVKKDEEVHNKTDGNNNRYKVADKQSWGKKKEGRREEAVNFVPFFIKEKPVQIKNQTLSPRPSAQSPKPNLQSPKISSQNSMSAMRSTLKALVQKPQTFDKNQSPINPQKKNTSTPPSQHQSTQPSVKHQSSPTLLQKQNQILRYENELLRFELSQIKSNLLQRPPTKKEEIISSLRDTIKKEDLANQELKLKLDVANKKVEILLKELDSKQKEINMFMGKMQMLYSENEDMRERNYFNMEVVNDKLNTVMQSFQELEMKYQQNQYEYQELRLAFEEEKSMYVHRIQFLENYIANLH